MILDFAVFEAHCGADGDFDMCGADAPRWPLDSGVYCTRQVGHPGDHVAGHATDSSIVLGSLVARPPPGQSGRRSVSGSGDQLRRGDAVLSLATRGAGVSRDTLSVLIRPRVNRCEPDAAPRTRDIWTGTAQPCPAPHTAPAPIVRASILNAGQSSLGPGPCARHQSHGRDDVMIIATHWAPVSRYALATLRPKGVHRRHAASALHTSDVGYTTAAVVVSCPSSTTRRQSAVLNTASALSPCGPFMFHQLAQYDPLDCVHWPLDADKPGAHRLRLGYSLLQASTSRTKVAGRYVDQRLQRDAVRSSVFLRQFSLSPRSKPHRRSVRQFVVGCPVRGQMAAKTC
jgi:hypothetical protein